MKLKKKFQQNFKDVKRPKAATRLEFIHYKFTKRKKEGKREREKERESVREKKER